MNTSMTWMIPLMATIDIFCGIFTPRYAHDLLYIYQHQPLVQVATVTADCILQRSSTDLIKIHLIRGEKNDLFEYEIEETGAALQISEIVKDEGDLPNLDKLRRGQPAAIKILVPRGVDVQFTSISGCLQADGLEGDISATTMTGDLRMNDVIGKLYLESLEGDVCVDIIRPSMDMTVKSIKGRATLNLNGNPLRGALEFLAQADSGRIDMPVPAVEEEVMLLEALFFPNLHNRTKNLLDYFPHLLPYALSTRSKRYGDDAARREERYTRKSLTIGRELPRITVGTGTGVAELKLN